MVSDDRTLKVSPGKVIRSAWIEIDQCVLGNRTRMDFAAIERAGRRLLQLSGGQMHPSPNGEWRADGRFVIFDGRHEFVSALALGRTQLLVSWLEDAAPAEASSRLET